MAPCVGGKEVQCAVVLMPASVCLSASLSAMLAWRIFSCDCQGVHGMRVEQTGETKVRTGGMTKEKQWPRMAKLSSPTAMLPTRDLMILFLTGLTMARGRTTSFTIRLTPAERQTLLAWQRAIAVPAGLARRGRIILLLADGMTITDTAATVGMSRRHTYKWIQRFVQEGLEGLQDRPPGPHRQREPRLSDLPDQPDVDIAF